MGILRKERNLAVDDASVSPPAPKHNEKSSPEDKTESSLQHPADQSWVLQILLEMKESFGEVKERTANLSKSVDRLSSDLGDMRNEMVTSKTVWGVGTLVITVLLGLGALIYNAVTADHQQSSRPQALLTIVLSSLAQMRLHPNLLKSLTNNPPPDKTRRWVSQVYTLSSSFLSSISQVSISAAGGHDLVGKQLH